MKIFYKTGNVVECSEKAILHGCNAQGVMGSGVAKAIKEKYPEAFSKYRKRQETSGLNLGDCIVAIGSDGKYIFNAITQEFYGKDGKRYLNYEALYNVLTGVNFAARQADIESIAMPKIGSGLAGGSWNIIQSMIEETSTDYKPIVYSI